ncbi:MAG TPA: hypothetical protein VM261_08180 [Kofleriaceae bacterium]|nr:hypothetical protein [Kofleriaceae bacterium]
MAFRAMPFAFVLFSGLVSGLLAGCNQLFGLDAPRAVDAAGDDDLDDAATGDDGGGDDPDGSDATDGASDGRPPGRPAIVWGTNIDVTSPAGALLGYEARASFSTPDDCVLLAAAGNCRTERCTAGVQAPPVPQSGRITIEGNNGLVDLDPESDGTYPPATSASGDLFDPGITVGVYSTGGTVPAFSAALAAPAIIRFTAPALPSPTAPATFTRASGLGLSWTPAVPDAIVIIIGDTVGGRTTCNLPGAAGSATIPATVLNELSAGSGSFAAYTVVTDQRVAGAFDVTIVVAHAARRSDNDRARGTITLQ